LLQLVVILIRGAPDKAKAVVACGFGLLEQSRWMVVLEMDIRD
jgi:hypothetical protein